MEITRVHWAYLRTLYYQDTCVWKVQSPVNQYSCHNYTRMTNEHSKHLWERVIENIRQRIKKERKNQVSEQPLKFTFTSIIKKRKDRGTHANLPGAERPCESKMWEGDHRDTSDYPWILIFSSDRMTDSANNNAGESQLIFLINFPQKRRNSRNIRANTTESTQKWVKAEGCQLASGPVTEDYIFLLRFRWELTVSPLCPGCPGSPSFPGGPCQGKQIVLTLFHSVAGCLLCGYLQGDPLVQGSPLAPEALEGPAMTNSHYYNDTKRPEQNYGSGVTLPVIKLLVF